MEEEISPEKAALLALQHIRANELEKAEHLIALILAAVPDQPDGLHALGALRLKQARLDEAYVAFGRAAAWLEGQPANEARDRLLAAWFADLGIALNEMNRLGEALTYWRKSQRLHHIEMIAQWIAQAEEFLEEGEKRNDSAGAEAGLAVHGQAHRGNNKVKESSKKERSHSAATKNIDDKLEKAKDAYLGGDYISCENIVRQLISKYPTNSDAHHMLAAALRQQRKLDEALIAVEKAIRFSPKNAFYRNTLGLIFADQGRHEQAASAYLQAVKINPNNSNVWNNLGIVYRDLNRPDDAISAFRKSIKTDPNSYLPHLNLAGYLHKLGRFKEALEEVDAGLKKAPDNADLWCNRGVVLKELGMVEDAEQAYKKSISLNANDAAVWTNLGNLLDENGRIGEALEVKERSVQIDPNNANAWLNYGNVLRMLGREKDATRAYQKALSIDGALYKAKNNMANLIRSFGDTEQAIRLFSEVNQQAPEFPEGWCGLGATLQEAGRLKDAAECYAKALALQPDMKDVVLNSAILSSDLGRHEEAFRLVKQGLEIDPLYPQAWMTKAGVLKRTGDLPGATESARHAIELEWNWLKKQPNIQLFADSTKPPMKVDDAGSTLVVLKEFLDSIGVPFYLVYGTLLGIYRDGELLPFDKDMDIGIPWSIDRDWLIDQIERSSEFFVKDREELTETKKLWNFSIVHKLTGVLTDFFFFKEDNGSLLCGFDHLPQPMVWRFRSFEVGSLTYRGIEFPAPENPEQFFVDVYGSEWRVPDPYFDGVVSGFNILPECKGTSILFGLLRLYEHLYNRNWKKAYGYCVQLLKHVEDALVRDLSEWLDLRMKEQSKSSRSN